MLAPTIAVVVLLVGPCVPEGHELSAGRTSAIRSGEGWVNKLIDDGLRRSPTFARLATTIAERGGIVYVEPLKVLKADLVGAVPAFVGGAPGGTRYARVWVLRGQPPDQMIETIGHELQHVIELFDREGGSDSLPGTTRRQDWLTGLRITETKAATHAGQTVHFELLTRRSFPPGCRIAGWPVLAHEP